MRIGMLTGGGDCPGLNAVIRAATRRLVDGGAEPIGVLRGWRGMIDGALPPARPRDRLGHPPARRDDPAHQPHEPVQRGRRRRSVKKSFEHLDGADRDRRRGHARRRSASPRRARPARRRRSEDDRQRPRGDRPDVRLRHRGLDRERGDRPAAHDGRVARPRDRRRGHGAPRRLAGGRERHRRRRRRRADPRVPAHRRALRRADQAAPRARQGLLDRGRQRGLAADARGGRGGALDAHGRGRRVRPRAPRRRRPAARRPARADHGLRDARHDARPPAARRHADRLRPHPRHALRAARGGAGARRSASD